MNDSGQFDVDAYERDLNAALDRDVATLAAQAGDFQQRMHAMMSAWQPVPPQMFLAYANGVSWWIAHLRQGFGPPAEWLASTGRPALGKRLATIIAGWEKAVPVHQPTATAPIHRPTATDAGAHPTGSLQSVIDTNKEVFDIMEETRIAAKKAFEERSAMWRRLM